MSVLYRRESFTKHAIRMEKEAISLNLVQYLFASCQDRVKAIIRSNEALTPNEDYRMSK